MDDPALADQVRRTALDAPTSRPRPVLTYHVVADEPSAARPPATVEEPDPGETVIFEASTPIPEAPASRPAEAPEGLPASLRFLEPDRGPAPVVAGPSSQAPLPEPPVVPDADPLGLVLRDGLVPAGEEATPDDADAVALDVEIPVAARPGTPGVLALIVVVAVAAAGFAAGSWLSVEWGRSPQAWGPAGAAAGLVAAWIGVRSSYRGR